MRCEVRLPRGKYMIQETLKIPSHTTLTSWPPERDDVVLDRCCASPNATSWGVMVLLKDVTNVTLCHLTYAPRNMKVRLEFNSRSFRARGSSIRRRICFHYAY